MMLSDATALAACVALRKNCLLLGDALRIQRLRDAALRTLGSQVRVQFISPALSPEDIANLEVADVVVVASADSLEIASAAAICAHFADAMLLLGATNPAEVPSVLWDHCAVAISLQYALDPALVRTAALQESFDDLQIPQALPPQLPAEFLAAGVEFLSTYGIANARVLFDALAVGRFFQQDLNQLQQFLNDYVLSPRFLAAGMTPPDAPEPSQPDQSSQEEVSPPADLPEESDNTADNTPSEPAPPQPEEEDPADSALPDEPEPEELPEADASLLVAPPRPGRSQTAGKGAGRSGNLQLGTRGRPRHPRARRNEQEPLALAATLRAAAPWQQVRRRQQHEHRQAVIIEKSDMRTIDRLAPAGELVLIIVDASGSMAAKALRTARATAVAVLEQSYRDRSQVGIIVAQGQQATIGLAPTRSTQKARECLAALPAAGGTPLASARILAAQIARSSQNMAVRVIELSDGRANVPLQAPDPLPLGDRKALRDLRTQAKADAERAATYLASVVQDVQYVPLGKRRR